MSPRKNPDETEAEAQGESENGAASAEAHDERQTTYVVMTSSGDAGPWAYLGEFLGRSQRDAKRAAVAGREGDEAFMAQYFIAVPASSYKPATPTVAVRTLVSF